MILYTVLSIVTALATATDLPEITPRLFSNPGNCYSWPTSPFQLIVSSAEDPAINGLTAEPYDIIFPSKVLPLLAIDLRASRRFAKTRYICSAGQPSISSGGGKLGICQDRNNGHILLNAPAEKVLVPELYEHVIDGVATEGRFLGVKGQTTWGFRYTPMSCGGNDTTSTRDYYEVKVLGLPESEYDTVGYEVEFRGFLKVVQV
ncbi:hypothetical protein T440DRAFT_547675 [Plenodomus tracheiphilus IPT5]|uniref:Ubiquitin 3 binding protein But2 C-terminal domain-containing protein n=1 Tax=Plenodomus tracheiphilus IPT5 TaxID=1408161 RepID=A0A6A7BDA4_9PLEO|nr:hypothetical protein T440DRAFT_547675 [Plenodomus tracheiphilus IPT5]